MSECLICGGRSQLQYHCNYCGGTHCSEHRLPENHRCQGVVVSRHLDPAWFRSGQASEQQAHYFETDNLPKDVLTRIGAELEPETDETINEAEQIQRAKTAINTVAQNTRKTNQRIDNKRIVGNTEDRPYTVVEPKYTVGTSIDSEYDSGPDTNPDGSLKQSTVTDIDESNAPRQSRFSLYRIRYYLVRYGIYVLIVAALLYVWYLI